MPQAVTHPQAPPHRIRCHRALRGYRESISHPLRVAVCGGAAGPLGAPPQSSSHTYATLLACPHSEGLDASQVDMKWAIALSGMRRRRPDLIERSLPEFISSYRWVRDTWRRCTVSVTESTRVDPVDSVIVLLRPRRAFLLVCVPLCTLATVNVNQRFRPTVGSIVVPAIGAASATINHGYLDVQCFDSRTTDARELPDEAAIRLLAPLDLASFEDLADFISVTGPPFADWRVGTETRNDPHMFELDDLQRATRHLLGEALYPDPWDGWQPDHRHRTEGGSVLAIGPELSEPDESERFFALVMNNYLRHSGPRLIPAKSPPVAMASPFALCAQLYNLWFDQSPIRVCANETCRSPFSKQFGRAKSGQGRTKGVKYCDANCAKAQYQRERRRRDRKTQETPN